MNIHKFQVVPPCGGHRVIDEDAPVAYKGFKSCPRVGGILHLPQPFPVGKRFKSCPRVGGIFFHLLVKEGLCGFKSCPRVGGIAYRSGAGRGRGSFKSCPRVGGIEQLLTPRGLELVSSRAPVWGASSVSYKPLPARMFQVVPPCGGHRIAMRNC